MRPSCRSRARRPCAAALVHRRRRCARSAGPPRRAAARPSSSFVPSRRTTNGTVGLIWSNASIRPLATSSQRVMPPKMLNSTALTFGLERITSTACGDRLGLRAAAGVEEVRRLAAGLGDDVERRHHEPGAVAEDADVAVELDVGQPALLGHLLLRVLGAGVAQRGVVGVAEERVVVERDLRVERHDLAVGRDDQRVDLDEHRLLGDERVVELARAARRPGGRRRRRRRPRRRAGGRGSPGSRAAGRRAGARSRRGRSSATSSMSMPPFVESMTSGALARAVEDDRGVVLGGDVRGGLDPHLVDGEAADVHAEDGAARARAPRRASLASLMPPALPRPPISTCALTTHGVADLVGRGDRLVDGRAPARRWARGRRGGRRAACPGTREGP